MLVNELFNAFELMNPAVRTVPQLGSAVHCAVSTRGQWRVGKTPVILRHCWEVVSDGTYLLKVSGGSWKAVVVCGVERRSRGSGRLYRGRGLTRRICVTSESDVVEAK